MKKILLLGLTLTLVLALASCSRQRAPDVPPPPSEVPTTTPAPNPSDAVGENNPADSMMDNMGQAIDDAARGIGNAARRVM